MMEHVTEKPETTEAGMVAVQPGPGVRSNKWDKASKFLFKYGIYFAFVLLTGTLAVISPPFFTASNIIDILRQISVIGILAVGQTVVIITAGIDLSVGSILALSAVMAASFAHPGQYPLIVPLVIGLVAGLACGTVNGLLISKSRLAPFIVTLGMMTAARGMALVYTSGRPVFNLSDADNEIGTGYLIGVPLPVVIFAVVVLLGMFVLHYTRY